jgi:hypothetical protein
MTLVDLLVAVDYDKVPYKTGSPVDIGALVAGIPTAKVVAGDPYSAVRIRVDQRRTGQLQAAVAAVCTVDRYADLDLY